MCLCAYVCVIFNGLVPEQGRDPNVSAHIRVAALLWDQTIKQKNTNMSTNTQTFNGLIPKHGRDPNVSAHIRIAVVPAENQPNADPSRDLKYKNTLRKFQNFLRKTQPNSSPSRDPNVSTHIQIAVVPAEHKVECRSQPRPECEHSHSDRGRACGAQS